jgi:hypothetical protein
VMASESCSGGAVVKMHHDVAASSTMGEKVRSLSLQCRNDSVINNN